MIDSVRAFLLGPRTTDLAPAPDLGPAAPMLIASVTSVTGLTNTFVRVKAGPSRYAFPTYRWVAAVDATYDLIAVRDDDLPDAARLQLQWTNLPGYGAVVTGIPLAARAILDPYVQARYGETIGDDVG